MDKKTVLERFQDIKELEVADGLGTVADVLPYFCKNVDEALLRLEAIDNANPSEALEELEKFTDFYDTRYNRVCINAHDTIKQTLIKAQEQEKILSIIKEKRVDMFILESVSCASVYNATLEKDFYKVDNYRFLTDEDFDSLKEMILNA